MPTVTPSPTAPVLERRLSPFDAAAIIVANVIGGGILFRSPAVAAAIPDSVLFLLAWAAGGVLAFMERLLDDVSFDAPDLADKTVTIDEAYVERMLAGIVKNEDLSRYIL